MKSRHTARSAGHAAATVSDRAFRRLLRTCLRIALWFHAALCVLFGGRLRRPVMSGTDGARVLLTGKFFSDNWISAHIDPILRARTCAGVTLVTTFPVAPRPGLVVQPPYAWLSRLIGDTGARLITFGWIAFRDRPDWVGGFHLLVNGLVSLLVARMVGARSMYFCVGGPVEVIGGGVYTENRVFERMVDPDPVIERRLLDAVRRFSLVVTMGESARSYFREHGVTGQIEVISGAVDIARHRPSEESPVADIVFVGRLVHIKRVDILLQAIALVAQTRPDLSAIIVGDGPLKQSLLDQAEALGVAGRVRFAGQQSDVARWLRMGRLFIMCSDSEGLSLALAEAMLCGLPAVVSDVGDLGDLVHPGVSGYLVDSREPAAFADAMLRVLSDEPARLAMAASARRIALKFDPAAVAEQWDGVLVQRAGR
jgi:L-malate glycosyltransferase